MENFTRIRLKYLGDIEMGQSPSSKSYTSKESGVPFLQGTAEFTKEYPVPKVYTSEANKIICKGDILFSVRAPVGLINISNKNYGIGRGLCAVRAKENVYQRYLYWTLHEAKEQLKLVETGSTYAAVAVEDVANILIPTVSYKSQVELSTFLDQETQRIDNLIKAKKNLLNLLKQKKQALINRAVTRGIDSDVRLKETGVDYLGEIPEHWILSKVKYVTTKIGSGVTPRGGASVYTDSGVAFFRSQNIHFDGLRTHNLAFISEEIHKGMLGSCVQEGDVLLNLTGASIGRCYYYQGQYKQANVNQHVSIVRPNDKVLTKFIYYVLSSGVGQVQIEINQTGGGREGLNFETLKSFDFPLPALNEQEQIIEFLDEETKKIATLKKAALRSIDLLKERRRALISAAVTGKIKIPEV